MSSKRELKHEIKFRTNLLMEDAFSYSLNHPGDNDKQADELIDTIADKWFELVAKVNNYPKGGKRAEVNKYFAAIKSELIEYSDKYSKEIDNLYKS